MERLAYTQEASCLGNTINTMVVMAYALGIVRKKDNSLLAVNEGWGTL